MDSARRVLLLFVLRNARVFRECRRRAPDIRVKSAAQKQKPATPESVTRVFVRHVGGRSDRIRTYDPLIPNQMRYQAALRSDASPRFYPH